MVTMVTVYVANDYIIIKLLKLVMEYVCSGYVGASEQENKR